MIRRDYFIHARKNYDDGSGGYSYQFTHFSRRSLFPESAKAFEEALKNIKEDMADKPGGSVEVMAFCRC